MKANADYMAANLKEYGWEYVVVDIEWYAKDAGRMRDKYQYVPFGEQEIDEYGRLLPDENRFPSSRDGKGFKSLAEYIHSQGLKFGIHIMRGIPRIAAHRHLPILGSSATADSVADPSFICGWNPDMYGVRKNVEGVQEYCDYCKHVCWVGCGFYQVRRYLQHHLYVQNFYSTAHEVEMLHFAIGKTGWDIVSFFRWGWR